MDSADKQNHNLGFKQVRVSQDMLDTAYQRGLELGEKIGLEKALEIGLKKRQIEYVLKGHENGIELSVLANITSLPKEEVIRILKEHGR